MDLRSPLVLAGFAVIVVVAAASTVLRRRPETTDPDRCPRFSLTCVSVQRYGLDVRPGGSGSRGVPNDGRRRTRLWATRVVALTVGVCAFVVGTGSVHAGRTGASGSNGSDSYWPMHPIDSRFRGANALDRADVNGDGRDDYVTNYEFDQRYVVTFTPKRKSALTRPWPSVVVPCPTAEPGRGCDTESATLVDLDGDGNLDIVGAQGGHPSQFFDGNEPGVRVFWGPDQGGVRDASAWTDAGRFPATIEQGHYLDLTPSDVNGDGAVDIIAGGRVYFVNGKKAGIVWLEAPHDRAARRDLAAWKLHAIDPDTAGGHGFFLTDLTGDGAPDIVDANADFDTPDEQESVAWYENPGPGSAATTGPWQRHELYRNPGFYGKPQIVAADINRDGRKDLITQTVDEYLLFIRRPGRRPSFRLRRVAKPPEIRWASRGLAVTDLDGDQQPDIVGMLTHDDAVLPVGKASVYWMSHDASTSIGKGWQVHTIKWSPGRTMAGTFGEKWDQLRVRDVNRDGAPDLVANDEEWYQQPGGEYLAFDKRGTDGEAVSVVWFENRMHRRPYRCVERNTTCSIEAEHPAQLGDGTWIERNTVSGASGASYIQAFNGVDPANCPSAPQANETTADCPPRADGALLPSDTTGATYRIRTSAGSRDVWVRLFAPRAFGNGLGGSRSDSVLVSIDDQPATTVGDKVPAPGEWTWVRVPGPARLQAGNHTITLRVRERGTAVDRIVLTRAGSTAPTREGPIGGS